jgi:two-component system invasion response regulator UvrY
MIRIVVADDHELIREGVKKIIRSCADMRIAGEAADLARTIALVEQHAPDVVVLD